MKKLSKNIKKFLKDENAISEEFTTLPALAIIMIGFAIFILLIASTYSAYNTRSDTLDTYQTAGFLVDKLTSPDCVFMKEGGIVSLPALEQNTAELVSMCEEYKESGVNFVIRLDWGDNKQKYFPNDPADVNRIAVSKYVPVYLNEAETEPGRLTIITWSE